MKASKTKRLPERSTLVQGTAPGALWGLFHLVLVAVGLWAVIGIEPISAAERPMTTLTGVTTSLDNDDDIAFSIQGPDTLATHEQASYALMAPGVDFRDISSVTWSVFGPAAEVASASGNVVTVLATDIPGDVTLSVTFAFRPFGEQFGTTRTIARRIGIEDKLGVRVLLNPPEPVTLLPDQEWVVTAVVENSTGDDSFGFFWNYGDGRRGSQEVDEPRLTLPAHVYERPGSYVLSVEVIDAFGAEGSAQLAVNVYDNPLESAIRGPRRVPANMRQLFLLQVRGGVPGYTCTWTVIPAAQFETGSDPCQGVFVTFPDSFGEHIVFATIEDAAGASATAEHSVQVTSDAPLNLNFEATPQEVHVGRPVTATATPEGGILQIDGRPGTYRVSITWRDGEVTSEEVQPGASLTATHYYAAPGEYTLLATAFDAAGNAAVSPATINVISNEAHWKLMEVKGNPDNRPLTHERPNRLKSDCTLGGTTLNVAHSRQMGDEKTVEVTFRFSYAPLPKAVVVGEIIEVPITLSVAGEHLSENVGATAGFLGYRDSLSVISCSLASCPGSNTMPEQSGTSRILFQGIPSDPRRTFEFNAYLNDTSSTSAACKIRYIYEFIP